MRPASSTSSPRPRDGAPSRPRRARAGILVPPPRIVAVRRRQSSSASAVTTTTFASSAAATTIATLAAIAIAIVVVAPLPSEAFAPFVGFGGGAVVAGGRPSAHERTVVTAPFDTLPVGAVSSLATTGTMDGRRIRSAPPRSWSLGRRRRRCAAKMNEKSDDEEGGGGGEGEGAKGENLLTVLDDAFDYEGRLPSRATKKNVDDAAAADDDDESTTSSSSPDLPFRCGFVGIVGAPNVGKSTLLNALLGTDLCVATRRPQTTRHAILGLLTDPDRAVQLCFLDSPGVIGEPAYKLQEGMMEAVRGVLKDADVLLVVSDMFSTPIPDDQLFEKVRICDKPTVVVVNKIDLADKVNADAGASNDGGNGDGDEEDVRTVTVPDAVARWRSLLPDAIAIVPASAQDGPSDPGVVCVRRILSGGPDVPASLRDLGRPVPGVLPSPSQRTLTDEQAREALQLPESPPLYGTDELTDRTERFFASEMIRASLFEHLGRELPYCCEVRVTEFKETQEVIKEKRGKRNRKKEEKGSGDGGGPKKEEEKQTMIRMRATVLVERDSQKGIVIGKGGTKIRDVGVSAREKLEEFFAAKVFLDLSVKVDKDWRRDEKKLKAYGYMK